MNQSEIQTGNNEEVAAAKEIARQKDSDWPQPCYLIGVMALPWLLQFYAQVLVLMRYVEICNHT